MAVPGMPTGNSITMPAGRPDQVMASLIQEGLTRTAIDSTEPDPALAESWTSNESGTEWTFKLREGVTWHDGEPFTADDVKFTYDLFTSGTVRSNSAGYLRLVESTEVIDPHTVKVTLSAPQTGFPRAVGYNVFIVAEHLLDGVDPNSPIEYLENPTGTGPFKFESKSVGTSVTVERNDDWWGGRAKLDGITLKVQPDPNAIIAQLQSGAIDIAGVGPQAGKSLEGNANVNVGTPSDLAVYDVSFATNAAPFDDPAFRAALNHAIDRESIVKTAFQGFGEVATGPLPPFATGGTLSIDVPAYDLDKAQQLLADAGYVKTGGKLMKDGKQVSVTLTATEGIAGTPQIAQIVQSELQKLGIEADVSLVSFAQQLSGMFNGDFTMGVEYFPVPPSGDVGALFGCDASANRFFLCDEEVEVALQAFNSAVGAEEVEVAQAALAEIVVAKAPAVFILVPTSPIVTTKRVQGYASNVPNLVAVAHMEKVSVSD